MDSRTSNLTIVSGHDMKLGASVEADGVNFALFSAHAERVELCLFDETGSYEKARLTLPEYTGEVWHGFVPGLKPGALYGYRVHGPFDPGNGHRFNANKLLLDPYARSLAGSVSVSDTHFAYSLDAEDKDLTFDERDNAAFMPKARVVGGAGKLGAGNVRKPMAWAETLIYETHVKGFTQLLPGLDDTVRGTYEGMAHPAAVEHIKALGITAVELLPVHEFLDDFTLLDRGLKNYWGYNSLAFFSPAARYFGPRGADGFRDMVRAYHDAGIEVILDVVYNHTCEGNELGPTLSFKGIDNFSYYRTMPDNHRYYINDTGTGNTLNTSHPRVLQMVLDSLRYWVEHFEIDGFRFDLGTVLGREPQGFDQRGSFFDAVGQDPVLARVKLIGEPWDIGPGGYQVGGFPPGWAEWNDKYRDSVREYWKGDANTAPDFAARILGSGDLYDQRGRRPWASVNFITAHDGFTLNDLVSYDNKHNEANGEDNNDGHNANRSHNYGAEGATDDAGILEIRARQKRNFLTTLLLSHGTPMLLAGDEFGRTQQGNNNTYCQDNELNWVDWEGRSESDLALQAFTQRLISMRRSQPIFRRESWRDGMLVNWFNAGGGAQLPEHWTEETTLCLHLARADLAGQKGIWADVLILFNPTLDPVAFRLADMKGGAWVVELSTDDPSRESALVDGEELRLESRSMAVLRRA